MIVPARGLSLNYFAIEMMPSLRCNANCSHCLFSPEQRSAGRFDKNLFMKVFRSFLSVHRVGFTGGEPFYDLDILFSLAKRANRKHKIFTIVTNGLWTKSCDAEKLLRELKSLGLSGLAVSYDYYHHPRIEKRELFALLDTAAQLGIRINVKCCGRRMREFVLEIKRRYKRKNIPILVEWFSLDRSASWRSRKTDSTKRGSSNSCNQLGRPLLFYDGTIYACCSVETLRMDNDWLIRGNAKKRPLADILRESERDFRLIAIAALGPAGLARLAGARYDINRTGCENCVRILNDYESRKKIENKLKTDRELRKKIVGRFMLLRMKLDRVYKDQNKQWRAYERRLRACSASG